MGNEKETDDGLPQLEITCESCDGKWFPCHRCGGSGLVPTEAGKKIIALIEHNFLRIENSARDEVS